MLPYASTIFLSAFLLFLVQPLIAKQILPWFGGSAAVWTTCLLFFQTVLLAGYAYADASVRWLKPRAQVVLHLALLALSLAWLPIIADAAWKPAGSDTPIARILALLVVAIGLPYLMLSSTTPLLQAWFWRRHRAAVPYRLFALSNFASLLALLGYPLLVEPWLGGLQAARWWSALYGLFVAVCASTALVSVRGKAALPHSETPPEPANDLGAAPVGATTIALWVALPAMGSVLLLAITNHVTQNIAPVPFLWVMPLALYLLSFIICFDHPRWYRRIVFVPLVWIAVLLMGSMSDSLELTKATAVYAAGLFVGCMFCHGELARLRPDPGRLTLYYLVIALGGALGALAVAIGAPLLLNGYYEMQLALVLLAIITAVRMLELRLEVRLLAGAMVVLVAWFSWGSLKSYREDVRIMERDFYGVVRTKDKKEVFPFRAMYNGAINHGGQLLDPKLSMAASTYFGPTSAYGRVFASLPPGPRRVGVIGLGAGALAAYAKPGDRWVFYEIAPTVVDVAQHEFSFLKQSAAAGTEIVLGDGRLSLERETPRGYDVLAIDAFSGDSIPMHLLTREAFDVYIRHLKPDGVIIFQATNRYVDILPVIRRIADESGFTTAHVTDSPRFEEGPEYWLSSTDQVIVTRNQKLLNAPLIRTASEPAPQKAGLPLFTDDYYNLLRILK